jgi:hypothetical protein
MVKRVLVAKHQIERTFLWGSIQNVLPEIRRMLREDGIQSCTFNTADGFRANGLNGLVPRLVRFS